MLSVTFLKMSEGGRDVDGTNQFVNKIMDKWNEYDAEQERLQKALDSGEEVEYSADDYVRLLKERGQVTLDE